MEFLLPFGITKIQVLNSTVEKINLSKLKKLCSEFNIWISVLPSGSKTTTRNVFDYFKINMKWNGFWGTNLKRIAFSDTIKLSISIYLTWPNFTWIRNKSSSQWRVINLYLRNWRHYESLQKYQEDGNYVKFNTLEAPKLQWRDPKLKNI